VQLSTPIPTLSAIIHIVTDRQTDRQTDNSEQYHANSRLRRSVIG